MKSSRSTKNEMKKDTLEISKDLAAQINKGMEELVKKTFKEGMTPKEIMGMNNQAMENIYAQAYRLYNTGRYLEGIQLFRILHMMNPVEPKYLLGLAACFQMLKEHKNAIQIYTMCSLVDPTTPIPHYHSSDCFIQMNDPLSAMLCLQMAIDKAGNKPEYATIKERSKLSLETLKQNNPSQGNKP